MFQVFLSSLRASVLNYYLMPISTIPAQLHIHCSLTIHDKDIAHFICEIVLNGGHSLIIRYDVTMARETSCLPTIYIYIYIYIYREREREREREHYCRKVPRTLAKTLKIPKAYSKQPALIFNVLNGSKSSYPQYSWLPFRNLTASYTSKLQKISLSVDAMILSVEIIV